MTIATYTYDPTGRRIKKDVQNSGDRVTMASMTCAEQLGSCTTKPDYLLCHT